MVNICSNWTILVCFTISKCSFIKILIVSDWNADLIDNDMQQGPQKAKLTILHNKTQNLDTPISCQTTSPHSSARLVKQNSENNVSKVQDTVKQVMRYCRTAFRNATKGQFRSSYKITLFADKKS